MILNYVIYARRNVSIMSFGRSLVDVVWLMLFGFPKECVLETWLFAEINLTFE